MEGSEPIAVIAHALGAPRTFSIEPSDPGPPGPSQVRVRIHACGVSFVDVLMAAGKYQVKPPVPYIPCTEFSGVIEAVGEGVPAERLDERVLASGFGGGLAQVSVLDAARARPIPPSMSFQEAAVFQVSFATAYHALVQRGAVKAGETVLIIGAGGAVGQAAVMVAKALGARVIASASTEAKRRAAKAAGADALLESGSANWRDQIKALTDNRGVDVVCDPVGGEETERAFRALAWKGRHLVIGFAGGIAKLPTNLPLLKGAALIGVDLRQFNLNEPEVSAANNKALFALYEQGALKPAIAKTYALKDFAIAMEEVSAGASAGRIVVLP